MKQLISVDELRELNAQEWQDFKAHWPMRVLDLAIDLGAGTVLGVALGLAALIATMEHLA